MRLEPLRAIVLALAAAAGAGIALGIGPSTGPPQAASTRRTTTQRVTTAPPATTTAAPPTTTTTAPPPTTTTPPATTIPPRTTTTAPVPPPHIIPWPGGSGWTVILTSVPADGHTEAIDDANRAIHAGLKNVGVLLSSRYPSLHAGYWVVFAGAYGTEAGAQAELPRANAAGFTSAYPRYVSAR